MKFSLAALSVTALLWAGAAHSALIEYAGGATYQTPPPVPGSWLGNHVIPNTWGRVGGTLSIAVNTVIDWTFLGKEAGYTNWLRFQGCNISNQNPGAGTCSSSQSAGLLDFAFFVQNTGKWVNGSTNYDPYAPENVRRTGPTVFFSILDDGQSFYIALDDGGAGPDDNHDDWVGIGRLRVASVPEPGAMALLPIVLLAGLAGLGSAGMRGVAAA